MKIQASDIRIASRFKAALTRPMVLVLGIIFAADASACPFRVSRLIALANGNLGVVGTSEGWVGTSGNLTVTNGSGSLDGTSLGLYASAGDRVDIAYTATPNSMNTYNIFATSGQYPNSVPINLYYSFLYRFNANTNMSTTSSNKIAQVNRLNSGSASHFDVHAMLDGSGNIIIGVNKTNGTPVYATTNISVGETFFVVIRQQIVAGGGVAPSGNDIIDLWINPPASSFGVDEGSVPPPSASATVGGEDTSSTGPGRFYVIAGVSAAFDELRIATNSWADVTPCPTCCTPAGFDSSPANRIVSEGISATFSAPSCSSSPTYQWQVSTNSGAAWNSVTTGQGGTSAAYTTAPLGTNDNQNRYRCIVSVSCGGGSTATSGVAVVTVTPAAATPIGLILDDQFADLDRDNAPIGISNSIWFASAATSLSDGSSGNLVGSAEAGSSRLWIAYFTDDTTTNLPVHLAVGRALKASLVFKASNIVSNGGNSMRFGLFDYADNGFGTNSRVTADGFGSGSAGNGTGVRGYMLTLDWGTNFSTSTPEGLFARGVLNDVNLMGSTANFSPLGSGPTGGVSEGSPAFENETNYTLTLLVERLSGTSTRVSAFITNSLGLLSTTVTDTNFAFPRFDAFAIRPNSLETTADNFTISRLTVEVVEAAPLPILLNIQLSGANAILTWTNPVFSLQAAPEVSGTYTNIEGAVSGYSTPLSGAQKFFRLAY